MIWLYKVLIHRRTSKSFIHFIASGVVYIDLLNALNKFSQLTFYYTSNMIYGLPFIAAVHTELSRNRSLNIISAHYHDLFEDDLAQTTHV